MHRKIKSWVLIIVLGMAFGLFSVPGSISLAAEPVQPIRQETSSGPAREKPGVIEAERTHEPVALIVMNRTIAVFRATLRGYTPQDRASIASERINQQMKKGIFGPVTKQTDPAGTLILNSGQMVMTVTHHDLDAESGQTMEQVVDEAVQALTLALTEDRELHSTRLLLKAGVRLIVATVLFSAILWIIARLYRWLLAKLKLALRPRLEKLSVGGSVYLTEIVMTALRFVIGLTAWTTGIFATNLWLTYSLRLFPYTRPWGESLGEQVFSMLRAFGRNAFHALPNLLIILFIFTFTRLLVNLVKRFFLAVETRQLKVTESFAETARPTSRIIVAVLWLFAVVVAYPYIPGSGTDAFKGVSLFVGLLVSLGSTSVVGQAASGLILMYSRAFKPGEYVRIGDTEGTVLSLGLLSTKIRTVKNEEISIPSGVMISTQTKNYSRLSREQGVILYTSVTIGYDAPWRQVHAMLLQAADRTDGLRKDPAPFVLQTALSDFYVEYQLNACIKKPQDRIAVLAALHANIQDSFNEHGVQIMSPHYLGDPARAKTVPKDKWYQPPAGKDGQAK